MEAKSYIPIAFLLGLAVMTGCGDTSPQATREPTAGKPGAESSARTPVAQPQTNVVIDFWPSLHVEGMVKRSAIINGTLVRVGDRVPDTQVRVVELSRRGVLLEYDGQKRLVRVGQNAREAEAIDGDNNSPGASDKMNRQRP